MKDGSIYQKFIHKNLLNLAWSRKKSFDWSLLFNMKKTTAQQVGVQTPTLVWSLRVPTICTVAQITVFSKGNQIWMLSTKIN